MTHNPAGWRRASLRRPGKTFLALIALVVAFQFVPAATRTTFDPERLWSAYDDWEPTVAVDPITSDVYQLTIRFSGPAPCPTCSLPAVVFRRSGDGGGTWSADRFLSTDGNRQADPQIAVSRSGVIYAAWLEGLQQPDNAVVLVRSTDHGESWASPVVVEPGGGKIVAPDKPILAISQDGMDVYLAFNTTDNGDAESHRIAASHDGGATFANSVKTNSDLRRYFDWAGAVASDGTVYFAAVDVDYSYLGEQHINVVRSTDGGATWTTTRIDTTQQVPDCPWAPNCSRPFFNSHAALAIDVSGRVLVAYTANDTADAPQRIYVRSSTDGLNWSARQLVSSETAGVTGFAPALSAGPTAGDFRLLFQDDRSGIRTAWNTWYRRTKNGGGRWGSAVRLSDAATGAPYKSVAGYAFPYGDYLGLAVDSLGNNHAIWGEGTGVISGGGSWYTRGQ